MNGSRSSQNNWSTTSGFMFRRLEDSAQPARSRYSPSSSALKPHGMDPAMFRRLDTWLPQSKLSGAVRIERDPAAIRRILWMHLLIAGYNDFPVLIRAQVH